MHTRIDERARQYNTSVGAIGAHNLGKLRACGTKLTDIAHSASPASNLTDLV